MSVEVPIRALSIVEKGDVTDRFRPHTSVGDGDSQVDYIPRKIYLLGALSSESNQFTQWKSRLR